MLILGCIDYFGLNPFPAEVSYKTHTSIRITKSRWRVRVISTSSLVFNVDVKQWSVVINKCCNATETISDIPLDLYDKPKYIDSLSVYCAGPSAKHLKLQTRTERETKMMCFFDVQQ